MINNGKYRWNYTLLNQITVHNVTVPSIMSSWEFHTCHDRPMLLFIDWLINSVANNNINTSIQVYVHCTIIYYFKSSLSGRCVNVEQTYSITNDRWAKIFAEGKSLFDRRSNGSRRFEIRTRVTQRTRPWLLIGSSRVYASFCLSFCISRYLTLRSRYNGAGKGRA